MPRRKATPIIRRDQFNKLKERIVLTISDEPKGFLKALQEIFPFTYNVLSYVPYKEKAKLAAYLKKIFNSPLNTKFSAKRLALEKRKEAYAVIKASQIMILADDLKKFISFY